MKIAILLISFFYSTLSFAQLCIEGECQNGTGIAINSDGSKYEGQFIGGKSDGQGSIQYRNGDSYVGDFSGGVFHGSGVYLWVNGDKYEGQFIGGKKHGIGNIKYSAGEEYTGEFKNDKPHGSGECLISNVKRIDTFRVGFADKRGYKKIKCSWSEGNLIK
tara:strand:+ start:207 stop:689 length:483 start_codon:yes stop_codon:yes gene_type:complete